MKGCHDCPVAEAIAKGLYKGTEWEDVPCSTCAVVGRDGFVMEFNEERLAGDLGEVDTSSPELNEPTLMPMAVMRDCIVGILTLPPELRDVVAWRFAGMTYPEIAQTQGVCAAAVEKRHRRAMALWPGLNALFMEKKVKQKRRKKHAKKYAA